MEVTTYFSEKNTIIILVHNKFIYIIELITILTILFIYQMCGL